MNNSLEEFCSLMAETGIATAHKLKNRYEILLDQHNYSVDIKSSETILLGFALMSYSLANGVWSTLQIHQLRQDLMSNSVNAFVLKLATIMSQNKEAKEIAFRAANIDEKFRQLFLDFTHRLKNIKDIDNSFDSILVRNYWLEWIQDEVIIPDPIMNQIVPSLFEENDIERIEDIAGQVNQAAEYRNKKGFIARLLGL